MKNPNAKSGKLCPHCGAELPVINFKMGLCPDPECKELFDPKEMGKGKQVTENQKPSIMAHSTDTVTNVTRHVALEDITLSETNPRQFIDQEKLDGLAASIEKHGVIQPVTIRPIENGETVYEMVSGERRYRAARLAGLDLIPAYVKDLDDEAAFEAQCIENLQREDVHPLDEATGYRQMIDKRGMRPADIAERMDKSKSYVTKRLKMNDLIDPLRELFFRQDGFKIGHAIELARLDEDIQRELYEGYFEDPDSHSYMPTVRSLQDSISRHYMLELDEAIFDTADEQLYPEAGPCTTCPKRSANKPSLFPELEGTDRCTDKGCWQTKEQLQLLSLIEEYKDNPDYYFVTWYQAPKETIVQKLDDEGLDLLTDGHDFTMYRGTDQEEHRTKGIFLGPSKTGEIHAIDLHREGTKAEREENLPRDQYLGQEIDRLKERRARKIELDREKVQKKLIEVLKENEDFLAGKVSDTKSTNLQVLAMVWVLYKGLSYPEQQDLEVELGLKEEGDPWCDEIDVITHFYEMDDGDLLEYRNRLISRWLLDKCTSLLDPVNSADPFLLRKVGGYYAGDALDEARAEQAEEAEKRNARYDERIVEHREELSALRSEQDPESDDEIPETAKELHKHAVANDIPMEKQFEVTSDVTGTGNLFKHLTGEQAELVSGHLEEVIGDIEEGFPPTVQLLVDHVRADEVHMNEQADITNKVLGGVAVRYSQLTEDQARQVHEYLVEQGELEE